MKIVCKQSVDNVKEHRDNIMILRGNYNYIKQQISFMYKGLDSSMILKCCWKSLRVSLF